MTIQAERQRENLIVSLTSGQTALVVEREKPEPREVPLQSLTPADDRIYTTERDMPSLEQLLRENRIAYAVFERSALHPTRVAVATALAIAFLCVGAVLLAVDIAGNAAPDPLISLFLLVAGLILTATVAAGLRAR